MATNSNTSNVNTSKAQSKASRTKSKALSNASADTNVRRELNEAQNERFEELKSNRPNSQVTSAGETSGMSSASTTNVDGRVDTDNRDVETFESNREGLRVGDDRDVRNH